VAKFSTLVFRKTLIIGVAGLLFNVTFVLADVAEQALASFMVTE